VLYEGADAGPMYTTDQPHARFGNLDQSDPILLRRVNERLNRRPGGGEREARIPHGA